jgi:hypothetical protein
MIVILGPLNRDLQSVMSPEGSAAGRAEVTTCMAARVPGIRSREISASRFEALKECKPVVAREFVGPNREAPTFLTS